MKPHHLLLLLLAGLACCLGSVQSYGQAASHCTASTNTVLEPNATFKVLSISGVSSNSYCPGDDFGASVVCTNTDGNITTYITYDDCSTTVNSNACSTSLLTTNCTYTVQAGSVSASGTGINLPSSPPIKLTSCGNGTVTFNVAWTNTCTGSRNSTAISKNFRVVGVADLSVPGCSPISDGADKIYRFCVVPTNAPYTMVPVMAVPCPPVGASDLPGCWRINGGNVVDAFTTMVDLTKPGTNLITASAGISSRSVTVIVQDTQLALGSTNLFVNADDDNQNGTNDMNDVLSGAASEITGEDDLIPLSLILKNVASTQTVTLSVNGTWWGSGQVRVWANPHRGPGEPILDNGDRDKLSTNWLASAMPGTLWVEGVSPSGNINDVSFSLHTDAGCGHTTNLTVIRLDIGVDANRDGMIGFGGNDSTGATNPYCFWLNNNHDGFNPDEPAVQDTLESGDDSADGEISCTRDLQDFTRMELMLSGIDQQRLTNGEVIVALQSAGPSIRIFQLADGGYLTGSNAAQKQISAPYKTSLGVVGGTPYFFPPTYWTNTMSAHLLFEGLGAGNGPITVSLFKADRQTKIGDGGKVFLKIQNIKNMYQRWSCGNNNTSGNHYTQPTASGSLLPPTQVDPLSGETPEYILFVAGYNLQQWEQEAFGETAFKRLWWQGYKGRFGLFEWPTTWHSSSLAAVTDFDMSEFIAQQSATALKGLLVGLHGQYPTNLYLFAHSHGNVVVGEALRQAAVEDSGKLVNTYVACQAAVAVHCYDPSKPLPANFFYSFRQGVAYPTGPSTPNIYPDWFKTNASVVNTLGNYFNENDYALSRDIWETDQALKPDSLAGFSSPYGYSGSADDNPPLADGFTKYGLTGYTSKNVPIYGNLPLYLGTPSVLLDRYEIIAFAAEPRCRALGTSPSVAGFGQQQNLWGVWPPDPFSDHDYHTHPWHSGEFRFDYVMQNGFWSALLGRIGFNLK